LPHVIAVADAVGYAHSQGIIHRDLKPSNVVVGEFARPWWWTGAWPATCAARSRSRHRTWTTSRAVTPAAGVRPLGSVPDATATNGVVGTPAYMAPEQARGEPVDARADVYALGALLYETLAGAPPYAGPSAGAVLAAVQAAPPPSLAAVAPGLPDDLIAIVHKAMARAPVSATPTRAASPATCAASTPAASCWPTATGSANAWRASWLVTARWWRRR
jgi:serine/threonine protein kinase